MRNKGILATAAGLAVGAAIARGWKWRVDYKYAKVIKQLRIELPEDAVGGMELEGHIDDLREFDGIAMFTCMAPCCYNALSRDEVIAYGFPPDE